MDERTLLIEIISLLKDVREKKNQNSTLKCCLRKHVPLHLFKKKIRFEFFKTKSLFSKSVQLIKHRMCWGS